ncbi:MAG: CinA family protein [Kordiimonadaceae bacterium]|jgi:nicotinamide-nucleotide amidase|nr:CinA family protein [Kordiimonadaceae bacterium]MBT6035238.1 CinA family protein [Kordiimonadaceae bacterium]MBT6330093.1 CinA family protein [Kordiimonadaceae bacterium]
MFSDEIKSLATEVLDLSRAKNLKIATAESCTGGLIIGALTEIAGSSDVVDRGFVTYTNRAKMECLGVSADTLKIDGAVSPEVAIAMTEGAIKYSSANIAVSVTGIAGPDGGTDQKPVGLVHMAAIKRGGNPLHQMHKFGDLGRGAVRQATIIAALKLLKEVI